MSLSEHWSGTKRMLTLPTARRGITEKRVGPNLGRGLELGLGLGLKLGLTDNMFI